MELFLVVSLQVLSKKKQKSWRLYQDSCSRDPGPWPPKGNSKFKVLLIFSLNE